MKEAIGWSLIHSLWQGLLMAGVFEALRVDIRSPRIRYAAGCVALLTPLWLIGVCLLYMHCAAGWVRLHRLRSRGIRSRHSLEKLASELKITRPVLLLESMLADTPVVLGHFRPAILVPLGFLTGLPAEHVETILLHELAHISRLDYLVNAGQRLIEGLFFYHPAVWWISHIIRTERENCCDDMVVVLRGNPHTYAKALTVLEQNRTEQWAVAAAGGNLMRRITRLLYPPSQRATSSPVLALAALLFSHGHHHAVAARQQARTDTLAKPAQ